VASYYSVVQYLPDPVIDERINVGVVTYGDGLLRSRFLRNWGRVSQFGAEDVGFLEEFASRVQDACAEQMPLDLPGSEPIDQKAIERMAEGWINSIQLTKPRASLLSPDALLADVADRFLREPAATPRGFRDRRRAAEIAARVVSQEIERRAGPTVAYRLVRTPYVIPGKVYPHNKLDVAVKNGKFYLAAQGLSFEVRKLSDLDAQLKDALLTLSDLRAAYGDIGLGIVALPPKEGANNYRETVDRYQEAQRACAKIRAEFVPEGSAAGWAEAAVAPALADPIARPF
jgi:hypothetical protein